MLSVGDGIHEVYLVTEDWLIQLHAPFRTFRREACLLDYTPLSGILTLTIEPPFDIRAEVLRLLDNDTGSKMPAIKFVRAHTNFTLVQAKKYVDWCKRNRTRLFHPPSPTDPVSVPLT